MPVERDLMPDSLIAIKVYQLSAIQKQLADHKALYDLMAGQMNVLKQQKAKLESELQEEQDFQFTKHGVASIHPALSMRNSKVRDFGETSVEDVPKADRAKFLIISDKNMGKALDILATSKAGKGLLSVNQKELGKIAEKKIPTWSTFEQTEVRKPSLSKKLGEFLYNPLAEE